MENDRKRGTGALRLVDLTKVFGDHRADRVVAVDHLSLEVAAGEFVVLLGPSGCGKTTVLRLVAGFEEPTSGDVYLGDRQLTSLLPNQRDIGFVFQNYALFPHLTVFQNVAYGLEAHGVPAPERRRRVEEALELVGLPGLGARYPHQLSGGQQQRVALGRAIVRNPVLYLMDEPLSNLDAQVRASVRAEIKQLQRALGVTTLYVTHDQVEAMTLADRMAVIHRGAVQQVGPPLDVYRTPANEFVARFLASPRFNVVDGAVERGPGMLTIQTRLGTFRWTAPPDSLRGGDGVRVGLRPEEVKVSLAPLDGAVPLPVRLVEALCPEVLLHLGSGTDVVVVRIPADMLPERPERVWIRPSGCVVHLFDPENGEAVGHFVAG